MTTHEKIVCFLIIFTLYLTVTGHEDSARKIGKQIIHGRPNSYQDGYSWSLWLQFEDGTVENTKEKEQIKMISHLKSLMNLPMN
ncbi:hypothetical protein WMZ97_00430 [Lentibacillus sp. N15]